MTPEIAARVAAVPGFRIEVRKDWYHLFVYELPVVKVKNPKTLVSWVQKIEDKPDPRAWAQHRIDQQEAMRRYYNQQGAVKTEVCRLLRSIGVPYKVERAWTTSVYIHLRRDPWGTVRISDHPSPHTEFLADFRVPRRYKGRIRDLESARRTMSNLRESLGLPPVAD